MSFVLLGILNSQAAGGAAGSYWMATIDADGTNRSYGVAADSSNNYYLVGHEATNDFHFAASLDTNGNVLAQKKYTAGGGTSANNAFVDIKIDSSDNLYIAGWRDDNTVVNFEPLVLKMGTDLSVTWARRLGGSSTFEDFKGVALDGSGNIYCAGRANNTGNLSFLKFNNSGTLQFQKKQNISGGTYEGLATDGTSFYATGESDNLGDGGNTAILTKWTSGGIVVWTRRIGDSGLDYARHAVCDSSGNVYVLIGSSNTFETVLMKYNSSGTLQWQRYIQTPSTAPENQKLAIDSSDNIYISGSSNTTDYSAYISKWDSSGNIQWQRQIDTTGPSYTPGIFGMTCDNNDDLIITGYILTHTFAAKLPNDGSLEQTFTLGGQTIVYEASSLTTGTSTLTDNSYSESATNLSLSDFTESLTETTTTFTTETVSL